MIMWENYKKINKILVNPEFWLNGYVKWENTSKT